jgi:DNA-binding XRE family transcriptional regulator
MNAGTVDRAGSGFGRREPRLPSVRREGPAGGACRFPATIGSVAMTGFDFDPEESFELALFRAAEAQSRAGHHFLAVVAAQAAVEAVAQSVFTTLFGINLPRSLQTMNELLPDRSFMAKGTRMLWEELTGESITEDKARWKPYVKHVERRNPAAHGSIHGFPTGEPIGEDDANESIAAARAMTDYLLATFERVMKELVTETGGRMAEEDGWRALRLLSPRPATPASERMAQAIRELRDEQGLSVEQLAEATRFHPRSIDRMESGLTEPSLTMLVNLAKAFGLSVAALVERGALDATETE